MVNEKPKTVIRVGLLNPIHSIDPLSAHDTDSMSAVKQVFEAPYEMSPGSEDLVPCLFDGPLAEESGGTLRGRLRPGISFSDGSPLTAEDVARSLSESTVVAEGARVEVEGDFLVFHLKRRNSLFAVSLAHGQCSVQNVSVGIG